MTAGAAAAGGTARDAGTAPPAAGTAGSRGRILGWYLPALAGTLAPLAVGFSASAEANRIAYAAWGLAGALAWVVALRLLLASRRRARSVASGPAAGSRP